MSEMEAIPQTKRTALEMIEHNKPLQEHWMRRLIAVFIDFIPVLAICVVIGIFFKIDIGPFSPLFNSEVAIFWVFYSAIMEYLYGATLGKMLMDLRVQSLKGPLDLYKTILRNLSKIHGLILLIDVIIGMLTEGDPRQRFMDRIAETTVIGAPHYQSPSPEAQEPQGTGNEAAAEGTSLPTPIEPDQ